MVDKMMRIAGRGEDGTAKAIKTDDDGLIQISSRTDEIILVNNEELRVNTLRSVSIDLSKYRDIEFLISNTLDQPVNIAIDIDQVNPRIVRSDGTILRYLPAGGSENISHTVPSGVHKSCLSWFPLTGDIIKLPFKDLKSKNARLLYRCINTPTTGSLTIVLLGGKH